MDPKDQPKAKGQAKGPGSKDSKLTKHNKNVTSNLTDRKKEQALEAEVIKEMADVQETVFAPWQRQVIELQLQGWSFEAIIRRAMQARQNVKSGKRKDIRWARIPARRQFFDALRNQPEYREACQYAFNSAVESLAQETVALTRELDQVAGLKGRDLVDAKYKRILASLNIAERRVTGWQRDADVDMEVIVFEAHGGWVPTNRVVGSAGQGDEAETARGKWEKMRKEAQDA
jgi:hypothetical protein